MGSLIFFISSLSGIQLYMFKRNILHGGTTFVLFFFQQNTVILKIACRLSNEKKFILNLFTRKWRPLEALLCFCHEGAHQIEHIRDHHTTWHHFFLFLCVERELLKTAKLLIGKVTFWKFTLHTNKKKKLVQCGVMLSDML